MSKSKIVTIVFISVLVYMLINKALVIWSYTTSQKIWAEVAQTGTYCETFEQPGSLWAIKCGE